MNRNTVCRLCLKPNDGDKNYTSITNDNAKLNMLNFFIPNLNIKISKDPKICTNCTASLSLAYNFKKNALENEQKVKACVGKWPRGKVNLKEIEIDEGVKKDIDSPTCRICLKPSSMNNIPMYDEPCYAHSFKLVRSLVTSCIQGLNYELSEKPILCNGCWNLLQTVYLFKRTLVETEEKLVSLRASRKSKLLFNLDLLKLVDQGSSNNTSVHQVQNNNENIDLSNVTVKVEPLGRIGHRFTEDALVKQEMDMDIIGDNNNKENKTKVVAKKKNVKKVPKKLGRPKPSRTNNKKTKIKTKKTSKASSTVSSKSSTSSSSVAPEGSTQSKNGNILKPVEIVNKSVMSPKAKEKEKFLALFSLHTEKIITGLQKRRITRRSKKISFDELAEKDGNKKNKSRKGKAEKTEDVVVSNEVVGETENSENQKLSPSSRRLTRSSGVLDEEPVLSLPSTPKRTKKAEAKTPKTPKRDTEAEPNKTDTEMVAETSSSTVDTEETTPPDTPNVTNKLPTEEDNNMTNRSWGLFKSADVPLKTKLGWHNAFRLLSHDKKLLEKKVESVLKVLIQRERKLKLARRKRILRRKRLLEEKKRKEAEIQNEEPQVVPKETEAVVGNSTDDNLNETSEVNTVEVVNVEANNQSVKEGPKQDSAIQTEEETTTDIKPMDQDPVIKNMRKITDYFKKRSEIDISVVPLKEFLTPIANSAFTSNSPFSPNNSGTLTITPVSEENKVESNKTNRNDSFENFTLDLSTNSDKSVTNNNVSSEEKIRKRKYEIVPEAGIKKKCSIDLTIESVVNSSVMPSRCILPAARLSIIPPTKSGMLNQKTRGTRNNSKNSQTPVMKRLPSPPLFHESMIPEDFKFLANASQNNLTISPVPMSPPNIVSYVKGENLSTSSEEKKYVCNICYFSTKYRHHLMRHLLVHMDPETLPQYQCPHCPYKSVKKQYLKSHMLRHDPHAAQYKCEYCSYMTNRKDRLRLHRLTHVPNNQPKTLTCPYCTYTASRKQNLDCHMISHEPEARFACTECDYKTKRKSHLVTHMIRHADPEMVKIYQCLHCPYKAKRKHHLQIHLNKSCKGKKDL